MHLDDIDRDTSSIQCLPDIINVAEMLSNTCKYYYFHQSRLNSNKTWEVKCNEVSKKGFNVCFFYPLQFPRNDKSSIGLGLVTNLARVDKKEAEGSLVSDGVTSCHAI